MILSSFEKKDSPFVWAQFAARRGEKKRYRRLDVRKDDPEKRERIRMALHQLEGELLAERCFNPIDSGSGWGWVESFIATRWGATSETGKVYLKQWASIADFFSGNRISGPSTLVRQDCFGYVDWRTAQVKYRSGKHIAKNTAIGELKLLGMVMDEAVLRGMARENPSRRLKIEREESAEKPEISEEEEDAIRGALKETCPQWMQLSFHIGISTGLRQGECRINAAQVRWSDEQVIIERPKGGRSRGFAIPIYDAIRNDLLEMRSSRRPTLYDIPKSDAEIQSIIWRRFFDRIGMPHICFHCTRVTFITRGMRAGIPESVMMKMVNHASSLISRIYQRWTSDDVRRYAGLLVPARDGSAAIGGNPPPTRAPQTAGSLPSGPSVA